MFSICSDLPRSSVTWSGGWRGSGRRRGCSCPAYPPPARPVLSCCTTPSSTATTSWPTGLGRCTAPPATPAYSAITIRYPPHVHVLGGNMAYGQCCGSEMIYSGSGSSIEFFEIQIRIRIQPILFRDI